MSVRDGTSDKKAWEAIVRGAGCPLDSPRPASNEHWDLVAPLSISSLYLSKNQTYRGQCQLVFDPRHVARIDQLTRQEWASFAADLFSAQRAVMRVVKPDHVNIESLGNVVPHLHWHIIPRYAGDPRWGTPVWQVPFDSMPDTRLEAEDRHELLTRLRQALSGPAADMTAVGLTSRWVAANRALESEQVEPLYRDPFARDLAGEAGFDVLYTMRSVMGMAGFTGPDPFLTVRTRFFDDELLSAVRDLAIDQVVILAAGMDARAFRLAWPAGVTLFEVDRDDVLAHKEAVLARLRADAACDRRVVRQDLAKPWKAALINAGFDPARPAAFLAEGLVYYLDEDAAVGLFETLRTVAAEGSWLGLDAMNPEVLSSPFMALYLKKLEELGCPWTFGIPEPEAFMASHGWRSTYVLPGEPEAHYGRWLMPVFPRAAPGIPRTFFVKGIRVG